MIKSDTIRLVRAVESQPTDIVWATIKKVLYTFGYEVNWRVKATTDGEATMVAACQINCFPQAGLNTNLLRNCVDHTIHLDVDESLGIVKKLDATIKKVWKFVNYLVESCMVRQNLSELMKILGLPILAPMQGTSNRWFFKWQEVWWIVQLKPAIEELLNLHGHVH